MRSKKNEFGKENQGRKDKTVSDWSIEERLKVTRGVADQAKELEGDK